MIQAKAPVNRGWRILCWMWWSMPIATAQPDSIHYLPEIEITATRIDLTDVGKHTEDLDTHSVARMQADHVGALLARQTPLYVRSYGHGTLATLGIRGGSASHTQVMWNGIPIRNPMLGMVDLALLPSAFMDRASIHYGGHGAAFGSGAVGGLIALSNQPLRDGERAEIMLQAGSWENRSAQLHLYYGFPKLLFSTKAYSRFAENDFRYKLNKDLPERRQSNHRLKDKGLMQEVSWNINAQHTLLARAWYQKTDRQIPPTSVQSMSKSAQQDESIRTSIHWLHQRDHLNINLKAALLDESIWFQDSLILLYTENHFRTWLAEGEISIPILNHLDFTGGIYAEKTEARSDHYPENTMRSTYAAYISWRWRQPHWVWRFQSREEWSGGEWSPWLVDISTEWLRLRPLTWKASLSRNYRIPTLNDLHWEPGGNPELMPERGWTIETGFHLDPFQHAMKWKSSVTGYARQIDQWIMWMPPTKGVSLYWSPINVAEVNSRGLEWRFEWRDEMHPFDFRLKSAMDLTWSTFGAPLPDFGIQAGDQLFYVPVENYMAELEIHFHDLGIGYTHHWFGPSPGINEDLKAGNIASLHIKFTTDRNDWQSTLYVMIDNIWDTPYRLIERRPMPGQSLEAGWRLLLK